MRRPVGRVLLLFSLALQLPWAQDAAPSTYKLTQESYTTCRSDYRVPVRWTGNRVLGVEDNESAAPIICRIDINGAVDKLTFSIPGASYIFVNDLAASPKGVLAVIGTAIDADGRKTTFLASVGNNAATTVTRLSPYIPTRVAIASDETIWLLGWRVDPDDTMIAEYNVLQRFTPAGALTYSRPVRARSDGSRIKEVTGNSSFIALTVGTAWLTAGGEYIQFAANGDDLLRLDGPLKPQDPSNVNSLALDGGGNVLAAAVRDGVSVWRLDAGARTWVPVTLTGAPFDRGGNLAGHLGSAVIMMSARESVRRYDPQPPAR